MELKAPTRKIMHIDLNSFFASAEQQANPFLRNRAMGVGKRDYQGSAVLAASYLAKFQGIGLGTRYNKAQKIDPTFELAELDPLKYYDLHNKFIKILSDYTPQIEVYSIDEAFLDLTDLRMKNTTLYDMAYDIKDRITKEMGEVILCSIGIANNKLLSKIGSNHDKPDGITQIKWEDRYKFLDPLQIEDVWGIGRNVSKKMHMRGIHTVHQLRKLSDQELYSIIGGYYTRIRLLVEGYHYEEVKTQRENTPPQSMQHAHTLEEATSDPRRLAQLMRKITEKIAIRLRKHNQRTKEAYIGLAMADRKDYGWGSNNWLGSRVKLTKYTNHGYDIYKACLPVLYGFDFKNTPIRRLVVGVHHLTQPEIITFDENQNEKEKKLDLLFDEINQRYGEFTLRTADILYEYAKESELSVDHKELRFHSLH